MIALVFCGDLKYCPYIQRYIERLEKNKKEYKVYFWNRSSFKLDLPSNYSFFDEGSDLKKNKFQKCLDFIKFTLWIKKELKKSKINKLIILSTLTGILLAPHILKNNIRYIFDIRDYSYESLRIFFMIEKAVIKKSFFTAISSKGFENFLPRHNYIIAHNFNRNDIKREYKFKKSNGKITFVWNGVMRFFDYQRQYLELLKNDARFLIIYHGDGPDLEKYQKYCKINQFTNVVFTGSYNNSEKESILKNACVLNNCYGYVKNPGNKLKYAISNRYYDGIIYHIPQVVEYSGYKAEIVKQTHIGINSRPSKNFANELYEYYKSINEEEFNKYCDKEMEKIIEEDNVYINYIDRFIQLQ